MNRLVRSVSLLFAFAALVVSLLGCGTKPPAYVAVSQEKLNEDPWGRVVTQLRKETEIGSCRRILETLRSDLAVNTDPQFQPTSLTTDAEKTVRQLLNLNEQEAREIRSASYSSLDAVYLAECLYLRDVARSLDLTGLPPTRQAEIAFQWVQRQVQLNHWTTNIRGQVQIMPPAPPSLVLTRGAGSALERAYVFLALLQQIGLDGCLIGPPEAGGRSWIYTTAPKPDAPPSGPFWAVGVRIGAEVLLFDPRRGEPLPGPGGTGIATLTQIKANADQLKPWFDDKARPWDVTAADVKVATAFLAVPFNALAPRWQRFEKEMRVDKPPLRLVIDPVGLKARFATDAKLADLAFWNVPADAFSYTRALGSFTLSKDGGSCPLPDIVQKFSFDLVPWELFKVPDAILGVPEVVERLRLVSASTFATALVAPPSPRERIQRGQFIEVAPYLVKKRLDFVAAQERTRTDRNREVLIDEFGMKARSVFEKLLLARGRQAANPVALNEAEQAVERFWKEEATTFGALVDLAVAEAGLAESTYFIAVCLHEQAERVQLQLERSMTDPKLSATVAAMKQKASEAWQESKGWWVRYDLYAEGQNRIYPGRLDHTRRLSDRATDFARMLSVR